MKWFIAAIVALALGVGVIFYQVHSFSTSTMSNSPDAVIFEVRSGQPLRQIANRLSELGLLSNENLFILYAKLFREDTKIKTGEYELLRNMNPKQILGILKSGKSIERPFTVTEGMNIFEIADVYEKSGYGKSIDFLRAAQDSQFASKLVGANIETMEGYLFPETYNLTKYNMEAKSLIQLMYKRFRKVFDDLKAQGKLAVLTDHELVTLASIVEKETGAPEERPRIAGVFYNRLAKKMKLQTDPTIIYGMALETGSMPANITKNDIRKPTRYNTYVINGMPPGPIASPGKAALEAAFYPENHAYLFFVSKNDGTHIFSESYGDHDSAVKKFQKNSKARENKSWRDLKTKK